MQTMSRAATGFAWTLVRTDFKTRYHGTIGGFLWALLKPLAMFAVLLGVFSYIFGSQPHYSLRLILGLFLYDFFAEGTKAGLLSLRAKGYLLTRAIFPNQMMTSVRFLGPVVPVVPEAPIVPTGFWTRTARTLRVSG